MVYDTSQAFIFYAFVIMNCGIPEDQKKLCSVEIINCCKTRKSSELLPCSQSLYDGSILYL